MNNTEKSNDITRAEFLKNSTLLAGAIMLMPGFVYANPGDEEYSRAAAACKIIVPSEADALEKQAAQQLQQYLSKLATAKIAVVVENELQVKRAIYIGKTDFAKKHK